MTAPTPSPVNQPDKLEDEIFLPIKDYEDGKKDNNHLDNLEWVTYQENTIHAVNVLGKHAKNAGRILKDICINGHVIADNMSFKNGILVRQCKLCIRMRSREHYWRDGHERVR